MLRHVQKPTGRLIPRGESSDATTLLNTQQIMNASQTSLSRKVAFFSLRTQFENVGDVLINRELIRLVAEHVPVFVDLSRCPPSFAEALNLAAYPAIRRVSGTGALFARLLRSRIAGREIYYFLSPGGYFGDKKGRDLWSAWINSAVLWMLHLVGVKICHLGVSYERLGPAYQRLLKARSRLLSLHYVRDELSKHYAEQIGLRTQGIMPDLAFGTVMPNTQQEGERKAIALTFRVDQYDDQAEQYLQLVRALDRLLPESVDFRLIVQVERDLDFMRLLENELLSSGRRKTNLKNVSSDVDACFQSYLDSTHVISNRLHGLLVGSISGCIPLAVVNFLYNKKVAGLFETEGLSANIFSIDEQGLEARLAAVLEGRMAKTFDCEREARSLRGIFEIAFG